jgi:hypothetical protein
VLEKTAPIDAVATMVTTMIAITGYALDEDGNPDGERVMIGGAVVGLPFLAGFVAASIGRSLCSE